MAPRVGLFLIWAGASVFQQLHPVNGGDIPDPGSKPTPSGMADEPPTEMYDLPPEIYTTTFLPRTIYPQEEMPYDDKPFPSLLSKANDLNAVFEGPACAFPFTYKGKKYYMCTRKNSVLLWCSLDTEYQGNWKFCTERDEPECVFPFIYRKKSYESCTRVHSFFWRSWCSLTSNYDRDKAWKYC
ncbi:seminal plasma protein BSP-30 kDa [Bos javanicus]|uniref:seminal plasma protein BSP-30 kDa n=1 Tax=Bos javanicus TaxID=9906 RepID=UPI002AA72CE4|nr:seminal plasma protein BSP-30 kDa [Bos javanicus]